jgi:hypothetical protein
VPANAGPGLCSLEAFVKQALADSIALKAPSSAAGPASPMPAPLERPLYKTRLKRTTLLIKLKCVEPTDLTASGLARLHQGVSNL